MRQWERNISALVHLLALLPLWGLLIIGIIWLRYKEASRAIVFQALQAIFFQCSFLLLAVIYIILTLFISIIAVINAPLADLLKTMLFWLGVTCAGLYCLACLTASLSVLFGKDFKYPVIGQRIGYQLK